jgi:hypothetical protein
MRKSKLERQAQKLQHLADKKARREARKERNKEKHRLTRHHRKPRSVGGSDNESNISMVPRYAHEAWHQLFSNLSPETIALIINEKWISKDVMFVCVPRPQ